MIFFTTTQPSFILRRASNHSPNPSPIFGKGLNRSSCRSFIKVRSGHQSPGVIVYISGQRPLGYGALPIKKYMANPEGTKAREPYQNFDGEGFPSESTTSPPYREGLGEGGCFFYFFSSRRRKGESPLFGLRSNRINRRLARDLSYRHRYYHLRYYRCHRYCHRHYQ